MFYVAIEPDLILRMLEQRHADELTALLRNNYTHLQREMEWLTQAVTPDDVQIYIQTTLNMFAANKGFRLGIWWRDQLAGCLSMHSLDWNDRRASLGYWLGADFQGHGIITKSCQMVMAYAFDELRLDRLELQCAADNQRSRQVAQRLGFQQEGVLRQSWRRQGLLVDQVAFGLLRGEWSATMAGQ